MNILFTFKVYFNWSFFFKLCSNMWWK